MPPRQDSVPPCSARSPRRSSPADTRCIRGPDLVPRQKSITLGALCVWVAESRILSGAIPSAQRHPASHGHRTRGASCMSRRRRSRSSPPLPRRAHGRRAGQRRGAPSRSRNPPFTITGSSGGVTSTAAAPASSSARPATELRFRSNAMTKPAGINLSLIDYQSRLTWMLRNATHPSFFCRPIRFPPAGAAAE